MGSMMFYAHTQMVVFSEHAQDFSCSVHMPIGWEGLSMSTDECSVYMPINSRFWGAKKDSVPYMVKTILTQISVECGVVNSHVDRFFDGSG